MAVEGFFLRIWLTISILILQLKGCRCFWSPLARIRVKSNTFLNQSPSWMNRGEEVVNLGDSPSSLGNLTASHGTSLFDALYNSEVDLEMGGAAGSFSGLTLREISENYGFSLAFLGDYVIELGCYPPINVDDQLDNLLTGAQLYSLMECVNSLDPYDSTIEYDTVSMQELANELDVSTERTIKICQREGFNLPFGMQSMLHESIVARFRDIIEFEAFNEPELDEDEKRRQMKNDAIDVDVEDFDPNSGVNIGSDAE